MDSVGSALQLIAQGTPLAGRLTDRIRQTATEHHELLLRWNKVHNLTRLDGVSEVAQRHWADSLLAGLAVEGHLPVPDRVVDVGSGAGFPGLCLAALWPATEVTLVEPSRKRCSFLRRVKSELGLGNVRVEEARLEDLKEQWPGVVSRATFRREMVLGLVTALEVGGWMAALAGESGAERDWQDAAHAAGLEQASVLPYDVPGLAHRSVLMAIRPDRQSSGPA